MIRLCLVLAVILFAIAIKTLAIRNSFRVYGGVALRYEVHKYLVVVLSERGGRCSGSILSHNVVITAAHCFTTLSQSYSILHHVKNRFKRIAKVNANGITKHPDYDPRLNNREVDLAILKPEKRINFDHYTVPIGLDTRGAHLGSRAVIAGFGRSDPEGTPTGREGNVVVVACPKKLHSCVCTLDFVRAASGDSGGALVRREFLTGVISASCMKAEDLILTSPCLSVYVNVTANIEWIRQHLSRIKSYQSSKLKQGEDLITISPDTTKE